MCMVCLVTFFANNQVITPDIMESRNIITAREMVYEGTRERLLDKGAESLPPELEWTASEPEEDENGDLLVRDFCLRGAAEPEGVCVLVTADVRIHLPRISFFQEASGSTLQREEGELVTLEHWRRGR